MLFKKCFRLVQNRAIRESVNAKCTSHFGVHLYIFCHFLEKKSKNISMTKTRELLHFYILRWIKKCFSWYTLYFFFTLVMTSAVSMSSFSISSEKPNYDCIYTSCKYFFYSRFCHFIYYITRKQSRHICTIQNTLKQSAFY